MKGRGVAEGRELFKILLVHIFQKLHLLNGYPVEAHEAFVLGRPAQLGLLLK